MPLSDRDDLHRVRFSWPEPLVIELLSDHYGALLPPALPRATLVRLHQALLRRMVEDVCADCTALRAQLAVSLLAAGLDGAAAARGEEAVFFELLRVVGQRFRNSPRLRDAYCNRLRALLSDVEPTAIPAHVPRQRAVAIPSSRPAVAAA